MMSPPCLTVRLCRHDTRLPYELIFDALRTELASCTLNVGPTHDKPHMLRLHCGYACRATLRLLYVIHDASSVDVRQVEHVVRHKVHSELRWFVSDKMVAHVVRVSASRPRVHVTRSYLGRVVPQLSVEDGQKATVHNGNNAESHI